MRTKSKRNRTGFTLVELVVAVALTMLLIAIIYGLFETFNTAVVRQERIVEAEQMARNVTDRLKDYLLQIGRGTNPEAGQPMLVYASPYQIIFNADIVPGEDEPGGHCYGSEMDPDAKLVVFEKGNQVELTNKQYNLPGDGWNSDAETYRIYIAQGGQTSGSGNYAADSLFDHQIRVMINGGPDQEVACGVANETHGIDEQLAYGIRWDDVSDEAIYENGERQTPLFLYWGDWDMNPLTPDTLWGDGGPSGGTLDGSLDAAEIRNLIRGSSSFTQNGQTFEMKWGSITLAPDRTCSAGEANYPVFNTEDDYCDGMLHDKDTDDPAATEQDRNGNRKLDYNLLDTQLHRIEISVVTIAKTSARWETESEEGTIRTSVEPRNLAGQASARSCGDDPPETPLTVTSEDCMGYVLTWPPNADDGRGEADVTYYEVRRKASYEAVSKYKPIFVQPANIELELNEGLYSMVDSDVEAGVSYNYQLVTYDCAGQTSLYSNSGAVSGVALNPLDTYGPEGYPGLQAFYARDTLQPELTGYSYFYAYDTPCEPQDPLNNLLANDSEFGSITLEFPSITALGVDETGWEYWIYRSEPFDPTATGNTDPYEAYIPIPNTAITEDYTVLSEAGWEPIAKIAIDEDYANKTGCFEGFECSSALTWEDCCKDEPFFAYDKEVSIPGSPSPNRYYIFRDQRGNSYTRTGEGEALPPLSGYLMDLDRNQGATPQKRYAYFIQIWDPVSGCPSSELIPVDSLTTRVTNHAWPPTDYAGVQSFDQWAGPDEQGTRFTPPTWPGSFPWTENTDAERAQYATLDWSRYQVVSADADDGYWVPRAQIQFYPSKSERCAADVDDEGEELLQDIDGYWVVRERWIENTESGDLHYAGQRLLFEEPRDDIYHPRVPYFFVDNPYAPGKSWNPDPDAYGNVDNPYYDLTNSVWKVHYSEDSCCKSAGCQGEEADATHYSCDAGGYRGYACNDFTTTYGRPNWYACPSEWTPMLRPDPNQPDDWDPSDQSVAALEMLFPIYQNHIGSTGRHQWLTDYDVQYAQDLGGSGDTYSEVHQFVYFYYAVPYHELPASAREDVTTGNVYSLGLSSPMKLNWGAINSIYPNPGPVTFEQCDLTGPFYLGWNWTSCNADDIDPEAAFVVEARESGTDDAWGIVEEPAWRGSQICTNVSQVPFMREDNADTDEFGWKPGLAYDFRIRFYRDCSCPDTAEVTRVIGTAIPGVPAEPDVEMLDEGCADNDSIASGFGRDTLDLTLKERGPYCELPMETPLTKSWFAIERQYRNPWWPHCSDWDDPSCWRYESYPGFGADPKLFRCFYEDDSTPDPASDMALNCFWAKVRDDLEGDDNYQPDRIFELYDGVAFDLNRQYRYKITNYIDHVEPAGIQHADFNQTCNAEITICDTSGPPYDPSKEDEYLTVDWGQLCNPYHWNGEFSVFDFNSSVSYDNLSPDTWCPAQIPGFHNPDHALHDIDSQYICYQPFATDCIGFCGGGFLRPVRMDERPGRHVPRLVRLDPDLRRFRMRSDREPP